MGSQLLVNMKVDFAGFFTGEFRFVRKRPQFALHAIYDPCVYLSIYLLYIYNITKSAKEWALA